MGGITSNLLNNKHSVLTKTHARSRESQLSPEPAGKPTLDHANQPIKTAHQKLVESRVTPLRSNQNIPNSGEGKIFYGHRFSG